MKIIVDERERDLFAALTNLPTKLDHIQITKEVLPLGDISIESASGQKLLLIERKTCADLLASIKDGRYDEQSYRLMHLNEYPSRHCILYLIEGIFAKYVGKDRKLLYSTMTSLNYFKGFSVWRSTSVEETADILVTLTDKIHRDMLKGKRPFIHTQIASSVVDTAEGGGDEIIPTPNEEVPIAADYCSVVKKVKKDNITANNIGEIMLCQIPTISSVTAIAIMKQFGTFPKLLDALRENPDALDGIMNGTRKISKTSVRLIKEYLVGSGQQET